jgi:hypothetical protein
MKKIVYFHIDELARDSITASALKSVLAEYGVKIVYGNRLYTSRVLEKCADAFDAIVLPKVQFIESFKNIDKKRFPPIITLQSEAVGAAACDVRLSLVNIMGRRFMEGDPFLANKVYAFCLWGPIHKEQVAKYFPEYADKCHVVGHPRHDKTCLGNNLQIARLRSSKTRVGLITRSVMLNPFDNRHIFDYCYDYISEKNSYYYNNKKTGDKLEIFDSDRSVEDFVYTQAADVRILLEIIRSIDYEKYEVSLRIHPREDRSIYDTLIKKHSLGLKIYDWRIPYMHWLQNVDYVVGPASTSFYDVLVAGKIPLCTDNIVHMRKSHIVSGRADKDELLAHIEHPDSIDGLFRTLAGGNRPKKMSPSVVDILKSQSNYPDSRNSQYKIAQICLKAIQENDVTFVRRYKSTILFFSLAFIYNVVRAARYRFFTKKCYQSSVFVLSRRIKRFIGDLVA